VAVPHADPRRAEWRVRAITAISVFIQTKNKVTNRKNKGGISVARTASVLTHVQYPVP
jgi:hypothetical protein